MKRLNEMYKKSLTHELKGGDRRMIGKSRDVVRRVVRDRRQLPKIVSSIDDEDPVVRTRASYVLEKVSRSHPGWILRYKTRLLDRLASTDQSEVQWHLIQTLGRLSWTHEESAAVAKTLTTFLESSASNIVRVSALQALHDLSRKNHLLKPLVADLVSIMITHRAASIRARARIIQKELRGRTTEESS